MINEQALIKQIKDSKKPLLVLKKNDLTSLKSTYYWVISNQELIYCIKYNITQPPICGLSTCNNIILFSEANRCYNVGCKKSHTEKINYFYKTGSEQVKQSMDTINKRKSTMLEHYGFDNPMKVLEFKTKQQDTLEETYGVRSPILNATIKNKIIQTNYRKYGFDNPMKNPDVQLKLEKTNLERFGFSSSLSNPIIQHKKQNTCFNKFGVHFPLQSTYFLERVKQTKVCKYGFEFPFQSPKIQQSIALINNQGSKKEKLLYDFLLPYTDIILHDRTILNGKELDIYIPDYNMAIEFNGVYWHSEGIIKNKYIHYVKTNLSIINGIDLIHVFETEWDNKQDIVKDICLRKLSIFEQNIDPTSCTVKLVGMYDQNLFHNANNIFGATENNIGIGLYYNSLLVSIMSFKELDNFSYDLTRFSTKLRYSIIGAETILFNYFLDNYKPDKVVGYVDRRFNSIYSFYDVLGFSHNFSYLPKVCIIDNYKLWDSGCYEYIWTNKKV